jgi:hypothetical protein
VGALANEEVGKFLTDHCICTFQKVGSFRIVNGQKQGGNVASYFCLPDGSVLDIIAGPVDAPTFLREARWVDESRKMAIFESRNDSSRYRAVFQRGYLERLKTEYGIDPHGSQPVWGGSSVVVNSGGWAGPRRALDNQGRVFQLLAYHPMVKIEQIYRYVFEKILNERVSTLPVEQRGN